MYKLIAAVQIYYRIVNTLKQMPKTFFYEAMLHFLVNHDFGSFSVILAAILDLRYKNGHKMIKYLQNSLTSKPIYRQQHHHYTVLRTEVMRKLEFWYCAAAILAAIPWILKRPSHWQVATQPKFLIII